MKTALGIIAAMLIALAAVAPVRAQEWQRVNDSTWQRMATSWPNSKPELETGTPITAMQLAIETNRRNRQAGFCMLGSMGCAAISCGILFSRTGSESLNGVAIGFAVASLGLEIAGAALLIGPRVSVTPEGVVVKIGRQRKASKQKPIEIGL